MITVTVSLLPSKWIIKPGSVGHPEGGRCVHLGRWHHIWVHSNAWGWTEGSSCLAPTASRRDRLEVSALLLFADSRRQQQTLAQSKGHDRTFTESHLFNGKGVSGTQVRKEIKSKGAMQTQLVLFF